MQIEIRELGKYRFAKCGMGTDEYNVRARASRRRKKNAIRWQPMKNDRSISPLRRVNVIPSSDRWSKTNRTAPLSRARACSGGSSTQ